MNIMKILSSPCNPFINNNCYNEYNDGNCCFDNQIDNNERIISNIFPKKSATPIIETNIAKNSCISDTVKSNLCCLNERVKKYNQNKIYSDKEIVNGILNNVNSKLNVEILPILNNMADQIKTVQNETGQEIIRLLKEGFRIELSEMIEEIKNKIDDLIVSVGYNDIINKENILSLIQDGNNNVVTQIMEQKPLDQVKSTASSTNQQISDIVKQIMNNIMYTNPDDIINEIKHEVMLYLSQQTVQINQLLKDIVDIIIVSAKEMVDMINLIIDNQYKIFQDENKSIKENGLTTILSIIEKSKKIVQRKISCFIIQSNSEFVKFIIKLFNNFKCSLPNILKECKNEEYDDIKEIMNEIVQNHLSVILELALKGI
ncbi:hypothetical protein DMUE_0636 [Dictyocoela muelleri]|nr:hypothetical protein DMUE_0636 [Dictyocoela muelleri]